MKVIGEKMNMVILNHVPHADDPPTASGSLGCSSQELHLYQMQAGLFLLCHETS